MVRSVYRLDSPAEAGEGIVSKKAVSKDLFLNALVGVRGAMTRRQRSRKIRAVNWLYPWPVEKQYQNFIRGIMKEFTALTESSILPRLKEWTGETYTGLDSTFPEKTRIDTANDEIKQIIAGFYALDQSIFVIHENDTLFQLGIYASSLNAFNTKEWLKQTQNILGVPFQVQEPWVSGAIENWKLKNFELIRTMEQRYIGDLNRIVLDGVQNGITSQELSRQIKLLDEHLTGFQTDRLARDQIGKLNGTLTQNRQQSIGIETYIWMTAADERVRGNPSGPFKNAVPSHYIMMGVICRWDDSSRYWNGSSWILREGKMSKNHPGGDIQCRCTGLPNWEPIVEEADTLLKQAA